MAPGHPYRQFRNRLTHRLVYGINVTQPIRAECYHSVGQLTAFLHMSPGSGHLDYAIAARQRFYCSQCVLSHSHNTVFPVCVVYYPVRYPLSSCTFGLQHSDCLQRTSLNTYATILTEARNDVGQIVRGLLLPKMEGTFNNCSAGSLTAFVGVALSIVQRHL